MFSACFDGILVQWSILDLKVIKNFGKIHSGEIRSIACTQDSKYIFTSDSKGQLKLFSIYGQILLKDFTSQLGMNIGITCIILSNNIYIDEDNDGINDSQLHLYLSTESGQIKYLNLENFISQNDYWSKNSDYLVSYGIRSFNYSRNLNFFSSLIIYKLFNNEHKAVKEFLARFKDEIHEEYYITRIITKWDLFII